MNAEKDQQVAIHAVPINNRNDKLNDAKLITSLLDNHSKDIDNEITNSFESVGDDDNRVQNKKNSTSTHHSNK